MSVDGFQTITEPSYSSIRQGRLPESQDLLEKVATAVYTHDGGLKEPAMNHPGAAVENRINDALHALSEDLYPSIAAAARNFDVPTRTRQRRINGMGLLSSRLPNNKALSDAQEQAICEYIERLDSWEMSARPQMIERAANYLLSLDGLDRVVGLQ